jgi:ribosomal protein S27AE
LSWETAILFQKNEKMIKAWYGNREVATQVVVQGTTVNRKLEKKGILVLTNQRLLFLEEHGIFGKSYHQTLAISLPKIQGISIGGTLRPFVSIADEVRPYVFHIDGVGKGEFASFRSLITEQSQKRIEEIEAEKKKERVQIVIDFSMLKEYMEKGGLVLKKTKCPECGAPIALPTTGNQTKCEHCGSTVYAQDIFEKVKSLIG